MLAGGGADAIVVAVSSANVGNLIIDGQDGVDTLTFSNDTSVAGYVNVSAETVTVSARPVEFHGIAAIDFHLRGRGVPERQFDDQWRLGERVWEQVGRLGLGEIDYHHAHGDRWREWRRRDG